MIRQFFHGVALLVVLGSGFATSNAQAAFVGSFGINGNMPTISPTTGLATATTFTIASMATNGNTSGGFDGIPVSTPFSGASFTLGSPTGFTFTNSTFGTFTETAAPVLSGTGMSNGVITSETFFILGNYSGGTVGAATPASFTASFTQNGGPGTSISVSGTLNIPPTGAVPEPASVAMLGLGLASVGGLALRRRMTA